MPGPRLLIRNARRLLPDGGLETCHLLSNEQGLIEYIGRQEPPAQGEVLEAGGRLLVPGLVDAHVHLRDWGEAHKEDLSTGTKAALAGGFTTVAEMPNTKPPITAAALLERRFRDIRQRAYCHVGVWSSPSSPAAAAELAALGTLGFKLYLHRPLDGADYSRQEALAPFFEQAARLGLPVVVHAELSSLLRPLGEAYDAHEHARAHPPEAELEAVRSVLELSARTGTRLHIAHVSLAGSLRLIQRARAEGRAVSCEATPHHLLLSARELGRLGRLGIVEPPLRQARDAASLRRGLKSGLVQVIASDHAPHALDEKASPRPPPGFPGLEVVVPVLFTWAKRGLLGLGEVIQALTRSPCALLGLNDRGELRRGLRCDLALIDLKAEGILDPSRFLSKAKYSPFSGFKYEAAVHATIIGGKVAYIEGEVLERLGDVVRGPLAARGFHAGEPG